MIIDTNQIIKKEIKDGKEPETKKYEINKKYYFFDDIEVLLEGKAVVGVLDSPLENDDIEYFYKVESKKELGLRENTELKSHRYGYDYIYPYYAKSSSTLTFKPKKLICYTNNDKAVIGNMYYMFDNVKTFLTDIVYNKTDKLKECIHTLCGMGEGSIYGFKDENSKEFTFIYPVNKLGD